jgi:zinc transporter
MDKIRKKQKLPPEKATIKAFLLDRKGGGSSITLTQAKEAISQKKLVWIHFDYRNPHDKKWVKSLGICQHPIVMDSLFAQESRPRAITLHDEGLLLTLRNINFNPGKKPEDMISTRFWLTESLILSTNHRKVIVIDALENMLKKGDGPISTSDFLKHMILQMTEDVTDVVCGLDDELDLLEEKFKKVSNCSKMMRGQVSELRRRIIMIKRYLLPQREAFVLLETEQLPWVNAHDTIHLREIADSTVRSLEDLDAAKDRALVLYEECITQIQEQLNSKIYLLSVVAMIFMPLTFITGLLGINVGGIPGATARYAFAFVCGILLLIGCLQLIYFRIRKWI